MVCGIRTEAPFIRTDQSRTAGALVISNMRGQDGRSQSKPCPGMHGHTEIHTWRAIIDHLPVASIPATERECNPRVDVISVELDGATIVPVLFDRLGVSAVVTTAPLPRRVPVNV